MMQNHRWNLQKRLHVLTYNPSIVIVWQHPLTERHKQPKSFLFFGIKQQHRCHNVHGLWSQGREQKEVKFSQTVNFLSAYVTKNPHLLQHLTVSDVGISKCVRSEDPAEGSDAHLVLKGGVLGQGAMQVPLDLLCSQVVLAHRFLHQVFIVSRVSGHLINSPCE